MGVKLGEQYIEVVCDCGTGSYLPVVDNQKCSFRCWNCNLCYECSFLQGGEVEVRALPRDDAISESAPLGMRQLRDSARFWSSGYEELKSQLCNHYIELRDSEDKVRVMRRILNADLTPKEVGRAHHIADLEQKNRRLKREVCGMQVKAEEFNSLLFATGLIVHCTGCIPGAPANYKDLTDARVKTVERIARRLRKWWDTNKHRI